MSDFKEKYGENWGLLKWMLSRYIYLTRDYEKIKERERELEEKKFNPSGSGNGYSDMPHGTTVQNPLENKLLQEENLQERLSRMGFEMERSVTQTMDIVDHIQKGTPEWGICWDYYIKGNSWSQVASKNHYSVKQCQNIRDAALDMLLRCDEVNQIIDFYREEYHEWSFNQELRRGRRKRGGASKRGHPH